MKATHESSAQLTAAIQRCMPSGQQTVLNSLLDELEVLRAVQGQGQGQDQPVPNPAAAARAANARAQRTKALHAAIDQALVQYALQINAWTGSRRSKAEWLRRRMEADGITPVPSWRVVDEYLNTLSL